MSGHSKWSQIKHKKGIADQKKSNLFSKLSRIISLAAQDGIDPSANYKLQSAIEQARAANMPKDNIERAIKRAQEKGMAQLRSIIVQAIGPASVGILIYAITDNSNRTMQEIRQIVQNHNAKIVAEGSLNWMFDKKTPIHTVELNESEQNQLFELVEAIEENDDVEEVVTNAQ